MILPKQSLPKSSLAFSQLLGLVFGLAFACGCSLLPDIRNKPQYNNPFPQLQTVAVLPFFNQSQEPTLSSERVTLAYIDELQAIPGFEVMPYGVVKNAIAEYKQPLSSGEDFQAFARCLGVDAILVGSVVDYTPYYPPRMTMKVNWYAANPAFHPVLPGYGLPWGTKDEKKIPRWVQLEAQRALAKAQLQTQTPQPMTAIPSGETVAPVVPEPTPLMPKAPTPLMPEDRSEAELIQPTSVVEEIQREHEELSIASNAAFDSQVTGTASLPNDWPDARGFIPDPPGSVRPAYQPQHDPIISHMRSYNGNDEDFTRRVSDYFYFRDDARFGGWQAYLKRSEDFIRVCCHFHVTETLASRGGEDESRLIFRWPLDRYQR